MTCKNWLFYCHHYSIRSFSNIVYYFYDRNKKDRNKELAILFHCRICSFPFIYFQMAKRQFSIIYTRNEILIYYVLGALQIAFVKNLFFHNVYYFYKMIFHASRFFSFKVFTFRLILHFFFFLNKNERNEYPRCTVMINWYLNRNDFIENK